MVTNAEADYCRQNDENLKDFFGLLLAFEVLTILEGTKEFY